MRIFIQGVHQEKKWIFVYRKWDAFLFSMLKLRYVSPEMLYKIKKPMLTRYYFKKLNTTLTPKTWRENKIYFPLSNYVLPKIPRIHTFRQLITSFDMPFFLGNDQPDTQLLYFTIRLLWSSPCFEHYMLIIRRLNCIDAASGIVTLKTSEWSRVTKYNLLHCL